MTFAILTSYGFTVHLRTLKCQHYYSIHFHWADNQTAKQKRAQSKNAQWEQKVFNMPILHQKYTKPTMKVNTYVYTLYCFEAAVFQIQRIQLASRTLRILCHTSPATYDATKLSEYIQATSQLLRLFWQFETVKSN